MKKIDIEQIRAEYSVMSEDPELAKRHIASEVGDDTEKSLKTLAKALNEVIDWINKQKETH